MSAQQNDTRNRFHHTQDPFEQDPWNQNEAPQRSRSRKHAAQHDEEKQSKLPFLIAAIILAALVFFVMSMFGY